MAKSRVSRAKSKSTRAKPAKSKPRRSRARTNGKGTASTRLGRLVFYMDVAGEHRWSARGANGERIADSSEGYSTKDGAVGGLAALLALVGGNMTGVAVEYPAAQQEVSASA